MIKFYVRITNQANGQKAYYPSIAGIIFDDMIYKTATEAQAKGEALFSELQADPDVIFEWLEKYD